MYTLAMPNLLISRHFRRWLRVALTLAVASAWTVFAESLTEAAEGHAASERAPGVEQSTAPSDDTLSTDERVQPQSFGWLERVILSPELQWELEAKLDTGADTSSLDATKMRRVRYKGKSYVRFSIENPETGEMVSLRRPYVRTVRIRRHNGNHQRRRIVLMTVCLGNVERTIEVTLTDREVFDYPMLLGRSALAGVAIVDPVATFTTEPSCKRLGEGVDDDTASAEPAQSSEKSALTIDESARSTATEAPKTTQPGIQEGSRGFP